MLLGSAPLPENGGCGGFSSEFCVDAGLAVNGRIITANAVIEFDAANENLQLIVQDDRSGGHIVPDLPNEAAKATD